MTCLACFRATVENKQTESLPHKGCRVFGPIIPGDLDHYRIGPPMHPEPKVRYMPRWSLREDFYPTPRPHKCQWRKPRPGVWAYIMRGMETTNWAWKEYPLKREWRSNHCFSYVPSWYACPDNHAEKPL